MKTNPVSLKQSEALGISWLHRFRTDLFLRTQIFVIGTFFLLYLINVTIIIFSLEELHRNIATTVVDTLSGSLAAYPNLNSASVTDLVLEGMRDVSMRHITIIVSISLIATAILGYVAARIALAPTRNGLSAQKQFISNVAHELRTPLSIIRANSEILLLQKSLSADATELTKSNVEELDRISGIIDNLLTLNTFRHARAMNFESVSLSEIVTQSIKKLEKLAESKKISLETKLDDSLVIWGNKSGVDQIATNLIKNALIYTPSKGSVTVATFTSKSFVTLEVRDTGIGIAPGNIDKIFEPFYQVEASRSHNKGSGGLGLAIVSELVKFHKGKISIQSIPNVGTLIRVDFPHPNAPLEDEDDDDDAGKNPREVVVDFTQH